jgi:hypothetical protein
MHSDYRISLMFNVTQQSLIQKWTSDRIKATVKCDDQNKQPDEAARTSTAKGLNTSKGFTNKVEKQKKKGKMGACREVLGG